MHDFVFCTTEEGEYISDDNEPSGAFNPKVSDWNDVDDSTKPLIYFDKAGPNIFKQFKSEFARITQMIKALPTEDDKKKDHSPLL